jgi:hypothetical protein
MQPVIAKIHAMPMRATWPRKGGVVRVLAMEG